MLCSRDRVPLSHNFRQILEHDTLMHVLHHRDSPSFDVGCLVGYSRDPVSNLSCSRSAAASTFDDSYLLHAQIELPSFSRHLLCLR